VEGGHHSGRENMVFEGRIADMLQNQASRFLRGFTAEQIRIGLLKGRLELAGLALNPEPLDVLFMESEIPLVMKAGLLSSAVAQVSILQGELELTIDGLLLVLCPVCRWLARDEVYSHRLNEIQRLEFVHMRSQCQRRTLEHEMFRQLFQDYLSRLKITVKNVHLRLEAEGELCGADGRIGASAVVGMVLNSCTVTPLKSAVQAAAEEREKANAASAQNQHTPPATASGELLLAERVSVKGLSLYHEMPETARLHVSWATYHATKDEPLGAFQHMKQDQFVRLMAASRKRHCDAPALQQLMPNTSFSIALDLKSTLVRDGFHVDSCLVMEIAVKLEGTPSRLHFSDGMVEHLQWFISRTLDFQLWQFLHPTMAAVGRSAVRGRSKAQALWGIIRRLVALRRRIHSNTYSLEEAITMRVHCKEYVRLYKKKFNGPASVVGWRRGMPALTNEDAARLSHIELLYPADKLVNFRLMAHAELKTEMALNNFLNADDFSGNELAEDEQGQFRRIARELTPLEQLHLHGQHGYGVNIYRGLPPPPSSLKIRIEIQAPDGLWWVCQFGKGSKQASTSVDTSGWVIAVDCVAQPLRVLLVDSVVDTSVFTTIEVPPAPPNERPLSLLLGRTPAAFDTGSPARGGRVPVSCGGSGDKEWLSLLEMDGHVCLCGQLKTLLTSSPNSPWDIFLHLSCGDPVDVSVHHSTKGRIPAVGIPPAMALAHGPAPVSSNGRLRACLPLRMPSGQAGPLASMLRQSILLASLPKPGKGNGQAPRSQINAGPAHSAIAWLARMVCGTRDIAMFRVNVRLPPLSMQIPSSRGDLVNHMQLPRFDGAIHLEHGGLVDGFVVGLHSLRHFAASIIAPPAQPERPSGGPMAGRSASTLSNASIAWPLWPLEQAPPLSIISGALSLAFSVVVAGQAEASERPLDAKLVSMLRSNQLIDVVPVDTTADGDSPAAAVTLVLVVAAVMIGRRLIWDVRDFRQAASSRDPNVETAEARAAAAAVTEVHRMAGGMLRVLLLMGFPLHSRCLPIAAWAGALEVIQASALSLDSNSRAKSTFAQLRHGLGLWAARGAFSNLQSRQDEVIRYLLKQGMRVDETDKAGRTLLDWACWGGCEGLAALALRAGLLSMRASWPIEALPLEAPPKSSPRLPPLLPQQSPLPLPPSPLTLAVASRCTSVVTMLLRAGGDPHVPPRGGSCGALYLAVRNCEFELALQVLHGSPFVCVEVALGAPLTVQGVASGSSAIMKGDGEGVHSLGCKVRATVTLIDSIRRFAAALPRRQTEDVAPLGASSGLRAHPPGPHPDEGIFAPTHIPFVDILHPVMEQFPQPIHKVSYDMQVRAPPLAWLRRRSEDPWEPVYRFIECCLQRGFSPDAAVVSRALPALSAEACKAVQHMMFSASGPLLSQGLLTSAADGGSSTAQWFGAVLGASEDPEDLRARGGHQQDAAVVSCAKELRDMRSQAAGSLVGDTNGLTRRGEPWHFASVQARPFSEQFSDVGPDPLLTALMKEPPPGKAEAASAATSYLLSGPWQVPANASKVQDAPAADVPQVARVVIVGAPRVGKTRVAASVLSELTESQSPESDHVWLKMSKGVWPAKGRALAEVHVWDTSSTAQPGILPWLADAGVPCMLVVVLDAANPGHGAPADELLATCVEKACEGNGCIRVLAVDNIFPGYASSTGGREHLQQKRTPSGTPVCSAIRCNLASSEGTATLRKAFNTSLGELVRDAELQFPVISSNGRVGSKGGKVPNSSFGLVMEPRSSTSLLGASDLGKDRRLLGSRLRGDSSFVDPSAISWAWAAVCGAQGYLLEGSNNVGSALVLWERLEHVLAIADSRKRSPTDQQKGSDVAHVLLSALTNLGLVCPIPSVSRSGKASPATTLNCTWVLIPDFARRLHLTSGMAARIRGASSSSSASTAASSSSGSPPISARLVWNQGGAPSLRAALRDFMGKGVLGGGNARVPSRSLEAHRFALLEAGPTGKAAPGGSAGLEPGFLLTFDFTQASSPDSAHEDAPVSPRGMGACAPKPPASVTAMSPSGLVQDATRDASQSNASRLIEDDFALLTGINGSLQRLTVLAVGTSDSGDKAFWDVHCSGPHAQWAMRALLGEGNAGHGVANSTFVALSRAAGTKVSAAVSAQGKTEQGWSLPPPPCVVSASTSERGHLAERPTAQEFFGLGWLFNGPQAAPVRESLMPQQEPEKDSGGGLAACCAVLCGKRVEKAAELPMGLEDDSGIAGLSSCADFEASLLARSWKMAPRFLDEALASSAEAWAICSASLVRVAHDSAAAVGGERGRALPLITSDTGGGGGGAKVIGLVPEGPAPLLVPPGQAKSPGVLGEVRSCAGVEAWLRLCKPAALWSAAGYARGYTAVANELQATAAGSVGTQVVEALRSALSVRFTEQMILEVWDALIESGASQNLVRRAGGSWTQANGSLLLL